MSGQQLYDMYRRHQAAQGVAVEEEWNQLDEYDQSAWSSMADEINETIDAAKKSHYDPHPAYKAE